jgi:hypothetical protein
MAVLSHAISGKAGSAKAVATGQGAPTVFYEVTGWKIDPKIDAPKHCSNLTQGMKVPIAGAFEWSGTIDVMIQLPGGVPLVQGAFYDVQLHVDDSGANYYSGTILVTGAPLDCDINGGKEVSIGYTYEGASVLTPNGILTAAGGSSSGVSGD